MTDYRFLARVSIPVRRFAALAVLAAPFAVVVVYAVLGYYRLAPGANYVGDYQAHAYATVSYSDIIWIYIRDGLAHHPVPYLDFRLEYPVLLGGLIYLTSFAAGPLAYFTTNYLLLMASALGTIALLMRIRGADPWRFALVPTLYFYMGLNWDLGAIFLMTASLVAFTRRRDVLGAVLLVAAVWFKFFPIVLLPAILLQRYQEDRRREMWSIAGVFVAGTLLVNLPVAVGNLPNWLYFFTFNDQRPGDSNIWAYVRWLPVGVVNLVSAVELAAGAVGIMAVAWRWRSGAATAAALLLVWWLLVNKVVSPQYALYIFWALALLRVPWLLWLGLVALDIGDYLDSFLILHTLKAIPQNPGPMLNWELVNFRIPIELARDALLLLVVAFGILLMLTRARRARKTETARY